MSTSQSAKRSFLQRVNRQLKGCWVEISATEVLAIPIFTCTLDTHTKQTKHPKYTPGASPAPEVWPQHKRSCSVQTTNAQVNSSDHVGSNPARPPVSPAFPSSSPSSPRPAVPNCDRSDGSDRKRASHPAVVSFAPGSLQSQAWPPGCYDVFGECSKHNP